MESLQLAQSRKMGMRLSVSAIPARVWQSMTQMMKTRGSTRMAECETILLIEDNNEYNDISGAALEMGEFSVLVAGSLARARTLLADNDVGLIVLYILMPDGSGLDWCRQLRLEKNIPILFLSQLNLPEQRVEGLRAGCDDYLTKPCYLEELVLRVKTLLHRANPGTSEMPSRHFGNIEIQYASRRAFRSGRDILLSPKEFALLERLSENPGGFLSTNELYETLWGMDALGDARTVKAHIYRLRKKLGENPPMRIESSREKGYRLIVL
jgi:DNA-binding response OmpR family regulator